MDIQKVKDTFAKVINIKEDIINILDDGKVQLVELAPLAISLTGVPYILSNGNEALQAYRAMNKAQRKEIADWYKAEFDIKNDKLEANIEESLDLLNRTYSWGLEGVELFKDYQELIQDFRGKAA